MPYDPEYYAKNKEKHSAYFKKYREKYPEKEKERHRKYKQDNKEKHSEYERRRRARKLNCEFEQYTTEQILEVYGNICYICKKEIDLTAQRRTGRAGWEKGLHLDHVIPISRGGSDTIDNVKPTHGLCNVKKNRYDFKEIKG